jgi:hypothetical protein
MENRDEKIKKMLNSLGIESYVKTEDGRVNVSEEVMMKAINEMCLSSIEIVNVYISDHSICFFMFKNHKEQYFGFPVYEDLLKQLINDLIKMHASVFMSDEERNKIEELRDIVKKIENNKEISKNPSPSIH